MGDLTVCSKQVGAADPFFLEPANLGYLRGRSYRRMGKTSVYSLYSEHKIEVFIEVCSKVGTRPPGECVGGSRQTRENPLKQTCAEYRTIPPGGRQGYLIKLFHRDILVWEGQFTKGRIQISQSPDKYKIHNFRLL
jgi:hypothetical protein